MTEIDTPGAWIVYLLHFDKPVRGKIHYCGITRQTRLLDRMREHLSGHGASLTRQAVNEGTGWTVTAQWMTADTKLESRLKRKSEFKRHCTICNRPANVPDLFSESLRFAPVAQPARHTLTSWT